MLFEDDIGAYLKQWELAGDEATRANLIELAARVARIRAGKGRWNAYLDIGRPGARPGPDQVIAWLASPDIAVRLAS